MPRYKDIQIEDALRKCKGMVFVAARQLGCSPNTVTDRIAKSKHLQEVQAHEAGELLDVAELKLAQAVQEGELGAIRYLLSCKGRDRGYGEQVTINVNVLARKAQEIADSLGVPVTDVLTQANEVAEAVLAGAEL